MSPLIRFPSSRRPARRPRSGAPRRPGLDELERRELLAAPGLTLDVIAASIVANAGPAATAGTVTRTSADTAQPLTVTLVSSAPGSAAVPGAVVIPAGQASATFPVDAPTGNATPGNQVVTISGSATVNGVLARDSGFSAAGLGFGANAVTAQADGKIVAAGSYYTGIGPSYNNFAVRRFNANGTPDATFRNGSAAIVGKVGRTMVAQAVAVQPDGKVVVGGYYQDQGTSTWNMQVVRFLADGQLDLAFGADGWVSLVPTPGSYNEVWALAVLPDGKILIGGDITFNGTTYGDFAVARLNPNGSLDTTFGGGGYATTSFSGGSDRGYDLAIQADGKIVLAGTSFGGNSTSKFAVARWTAAGQPDATFGSGGKVLTDLPGTYDQARGLALQPDGKIVVAGSTAAGTDIALVRYTTAGALDPTFGSGGIVVQDLGGLDAASAVAVQTDGKIVVVGQGGSAKVVSRFEANGTYLSSATGTAVNDLVLQPGGRLVVVGGSPNAGFLDAYTGSATVVASDALTVIGTEVPRASGDFYSVEKGTTLAVAVPGVLANDGNPSGRPLSAVLVAGPKRGALHLNPDGSFAYAPSGAYLGPDSFTYRATDGTSTSEVATVSLSVTGSNDAPVVGNDSYEMLNTGQSRLAIQAPGVLANDSDPNGQPIAAAIATQPAHGTVSLSANGSFTYAPAAGFAGVDSFTYRASDGSLGSDPATVSITVYGRPTAVVDAYTTPQDTPLTVPAPGLLTNDTDPNGLPLRPYVNTYPNNGSLVVNADGSFTYTPRAGFSGQDTFAYYVSNGKLASVAVTDTITVMFVNRPPVAADDAYSFRPDTPRTISAPGVLANDSDPNGQPLAAVVVAQPAHGSVTLNADGSFVYTPASGYRGPDSFTYQAGDGQLKSAVATVRLIVADSSANLWTQRGGDAGHSGYVDARIDAAGIADAWNQPLSYVSSGYWAQSGNRAVAIDGTHVYRTDLEGYWASGNYHVIAYDLQTGAPVWNQILVGNGPVSAPSVAGGMVYINRSGHSGISGGTDNDRPWLYQLDARTGATVLRQTYSAQWDSDERPVIEGDQLVAPDGYFGGFSAWTASTLVRQWNNPGSQSDTPTAALAGQYVYAYGNKVYLRSTGAYQGDIAPPVGLGWIGSPVVSTSGRLLFDVRDSEHYSTTYGVSVHDAATRTPIWTFLTPGATAAKAAGNGVIAVAAGPRLFLLDEATGAQIGAWQAPDNLTSQIILTRTHAFVQSVGSYGGSARVHAINLATGQSEWTFENRVAGEDGGPSMEMAFGGGYLLLSNDAFVRAFAVPGSSNLAPVANDDSFVTAEGATLTVAAPGVLTNDADADADPITAALVAGPAHGVVSLDPGGAFVYTPAPGFSGSDRFTYRTNDGRADSDVASVTILVDATPTAAGQAVALAQGGSKPITLQATDPEGAGLTFTVVTGPAHGTLSGTAPNLVYTPAGGYSGPDRFTFQASDGRSPSAPATVAILVKPGLAITWDTPAAIVYGTPLGASQLNAAANIDGAFTYIPAAGTILNAGASQILTATFTPSDPDYPTTAAQTTITVLKATPTITWATPAAITYGTPLGDSQLNATVSVSGSFAYLPAPGTVLNAGAGQVLTARFTPADPANYQGVTVTRPIDVRKAVLTVSPANKDMGRGDAVPALTSTLSGFVNGDSASVVGGSAALSTTATSSSAAARYPIAAGAGSLAATNYEFQFTSGTLTVHPKVLDVRVRWGSKSMSLIGLNRVLPFVNITAVDVVFSDDVTVGNGNLALTSTTAAARTYGFTEFRFNPNTDTASWTLPTALGIDRLMLALDTRFGAQADPTISVWNTIGPVRFGVLPGDIDGNGQVNNQDVGLYKKPPASLLLWLDVDGDGDVDKADEDAVRRRTGTRLP